MTLALALWDSPEEEPRIGNARVSSHAEDSRSSAFARLYEPLLHGDSFDQTFPLNPCQLIAQRVNHRRRARIPPPVR